jgi:hypothetical protein
VRVEPSLYPIGSALGLLKPAAADHREERGTLPRVLVIDLADGRAEALLQGRLDGLQLSSFALQRAGVREVEVDAQYDNVPGHAAR